MGFDFCDTTKIKLSNIEGNFFGTIRILSDKWDLIFVILPKSNYVDDGSRDMTMADNRTRDWFTKHLLDLLSPFKDKIVILVENCDSDSFFADNYHYAKKTIKERLHIEI